ncbi:tripartite tricarboxylate transporter substrate binding protein [Nonomuraea sp. K274]|uniref:Tripartite tricarboxylate transporter substrate binding protein n=1 Tax=Nonomuraea cypriaca TaxID=1187855 RepID=A0A931A4I8_9ACTN|nr:tripartite tricarboxylate transporter substrate binding protein [Nonomuraea cypriaca]MBF8184978.1 tripartite tricarboxylate transporter substrate binding protein [Nonomuraea cypriaca]
MKHTTRSRALAGAFALLLSITACGTTAGEDTASPARNMHVVVGNSPGGGYDTMARQIAKTLSDTKIVNRTDVINKPGADGTVALQQLVNQKGQADTLMTTGLAVTGAVLANKAPVTLKDVTPIARVLEEPSIIAVSASSPYKTLDQLLEAWKENPGKVPGGGGAVGGPDYTYIMLLAKAAGIDPKEVNFVQYDGGGELLPAVLGNKVAFAASGYAEWADQIESGELRVLAVSSAERLAEVNAPTLKEQGVDLVFSNWRGFIAPPGISEDDKNKLIDVFRRLRDKPEWKQTLQKNGQYDAFLAGPEFGTFMATEQDRIGQILKEAGAL